MNVFQLIIFCLSIISNNGSLFKMKRDTYNLRNTLRGVFAALLLDNQLCAIAASPISDECITDSNPQVTTVSCRQLGLVNGRLRGCKSTENCFSTSAKAAQKYRSPWRYDIGSQSSLDFDSAWNTLMSAVQDEGLTILKNDKEGHYLLAAEKDVPKQPSGSSLFYEFLLKDSEEDKIVLYRGVVDKTIFLYPLQQPVSDFGALDSKLDKILARCGWMRLSNE